MKVSKRGILALLIGAWGGTTVVSAQQTGCAGTQMVRTLPAWKSEAEVADSVAKILATDGPVRAMSYVDRTLEKGLPEETKAELAYDAAWVMWQQGNYPEAAALCKRALTCKANLGKAYILLARIFASHPDWTDETALNRCTYFLVMDKLQRAKEVDATVSRQANELLARYASETPKPKDLFMLGYQAGDRVDIGGWIGESTTIR